MDKEHVLREIRRTASQNGGVPLGWRRFATETGIKYHEWYGQFWSRWGDAVREAGLEPNRLSRAYEDQFLLEVLVRLTRQIGRIPSGGDLRLAAKQDPAMPSEKVFRRLGTKCERADRIVSFCGGRADLADVAALWRPALALERTDGSGDPKGELPSCGFVYLLRHGSRGEYKIGRTNHPVRREGELSIQLPEKLQPVHYIETDDPVGVERYWHARFAAKRKQGEWFTLTAADVRAFKRWKRIY